jgi:hypothetical protein
MRYLNTGNVANAIGMPVKGGTWFHLQEAYREAIAATVKALVGSSYSAAKVYILHGMERTGTGSTWTIASGAAFYNGEVYLYDGQTYSVADPNVLVGFIQTFFFSSSQADPVEFTDGVVRNIHLINKLVLSVGLAGTGIANYVQFERINSNIPQLVLTGTGIATVSGIYPNINVAVPSQNKILQTGSIQIGDLNTTGDLDAFTALLAGSNNNISGYKYTFPVALADANYFPNFVIQNELIATVPDANNNINCSLQLGPQTATDIIFFISTANSGNAQALKVKFMLIATT